MAKPTKFLVYHYRHSETPEVFLFPTGRALLTEDEIADILRNHPSVQASRKPLPPGRPSVTIRFQDLLTQEQKALYADVPNFDDNVASVRVPPSIWLRSIVKARLKGERLEMVILSGKRAP